MPGASVEVFLGKDAAGVGVGRGETGEGGRFAFDLPGLDRLSPERRLRITLTARMRAGGYRSSEEALLPETDLSGPPREVEATLHLDAGHDAFGRVVDGDGRPLEGVRLTLRDGSSSDVLVTRTDAAGRYRFPIHHTDDAYILAQQPGVGTGSIAPTPLSREYDAALPDLVLRGAEVAGIVVDAEGRPAARVPVYAECPAAPEEEGKAWIGAPSGTREGSAMTDGDGRFRITGLYPGPVELRPGTEWDRDEGAVSADTGREDVRLVMAGHLVRVSVVDSSGEPFPSAMWSAQELDGTAVRKQVGIGAHRGPAGTTLRFAVVTPGATVRIGATAPGCAGDEVTRTFVGAGPSDVTLRVVRAGPAGRVRVQLTGSAAHRAVTQLVRVTRVTGEPVNRDGSRPKRVSEPIEVPAGKHRVQLTPLGLRDDQSTFFERITLDVDVPPGEEIVVSAPLQVGGRIQVTVDMPKVAGSLWGWVSLTSLEGGHPPDSLRWAQVYAHGMSLGCGVQLAPGATFSTAEGIAPGRWTLRLYAEGYRGTEVPLTVAADETTSVTAVLVKEPK